MREKIHGNSDTSTPTTCASFRVRAASMANDPQPEPRTQICCTFGGIILRMVLRAKEEEGIGPIPYQIAVPTIWRQQRDTRAKIINSMVTIREAKRVGEEQA